MIHFVYFATRTLLAFTFNHGHVPRFSPAPPVYQSPPRSNKRKRSDREEEVGAVVASTLSSNNHDFEI